LGFHIIDPLGRKCAHWGGSLQRKLRYIKGQIIAYERRMNGDIFQATNTDLGDQENSKFVLRTEKIRIYPKTLQAEVFTKWLICIKDTYNHSLVNRWPSCENPPSKKDARHIIKSMPCSDGIPADIREYPMEDLLNAAKAQQSKKGKNRDYIAVVKPKDSISQCGFWIRPEQWISPGRDNMPIGDGYGCFGPDDSFGEDILRSNHKLPYCLSHSCRINQDSKGRWFVHLKVDSHVVTKVPTSCDIDHVVALDLGMRTFMTTYSCDGMVTEWAVNDCKRIHGLHLKVDKLKSLIDTN